MVRLNATLRSYFWVLHLGLIASGAYLLADIANFFIASHLEASIGTPQTSDKKQRAFEVALKDKDYRSIIMDNIFNPDVLKPIIVEPVAPPVPVIPVVPVAPPVQEVVAPPKPPLDVVLIGTVVSAEDGDVFYAVIEDRKTQAQTLYQIGDFLSEGAKVVHIERNKVLVLRDTEEEVLEASLVPQEPKAGKATPSRAALPPTPVIPEPVPAPAPSDGRIRQVGKDHWLMDRSEVDNAIAHLPELLTKARVVPNFTDGKPDGFRIFAIRKDSLYARIGLQDGDILQRVNDIEVRNPQNFLQVFDQLKGESSITINLIRDNKEETFAYSIR